LKQLFFLVLVVLCICTRQVFLLEGSTIVVIESLEFFVALQDRGMCESANDVHAWAPWWQVYFSTNAAVHLAVEGFDAIVI
jgi:hypothetical protein